MFLVKANLAYSAFFYFRVWKYTRIYLGHGDSVIFRLHYTSLELNGHSIHTQEVVNDRDRNIASQI